jgi:hypothetical protein
LRTRTVGNGSINGRQYVASTVEATHKWSDKIASTQKKPLVFAQIDSFINDDTPIVRVRKNKKKKWFQFKVQEPHKKCGWGNLKHPKETVGYLMLQRQ